MAKSTGKSKRPEPPKPPRAAKSADPAERILAAAMEVAADTPDPLAQREMTEELRRLLECVGRLEPERQKLVLLAYYNGWSRDQLAAKFKTPVNTIKTWLRRSMLDIRECLGLKS